MSKKRLFEVNINDDVFVKVTEYGWRCVDPLMVPDADADGWRQMQLWRVMELFGPHTGLGVRCPIETTIKFELAVEP